MLTLSKVENINHFTVNYLKFNAYTAAIKIGLLFRRAA
jgi:hypothetical protein